MFRSFTKIYMKDNCVNSLARIAFRLQCPGTAGVSPRSPTEGVLLIKRPARDACLCMGELQAPAAPHFVFLITL